MIAAMNGGGEIPAPTAPLASERLWRSDIAILGGGGLINSGSDDGERQKGTAAGDQTAPAKAEAVRRF